MNKNGEKAPKVRYITRSDQQGFRTHDLLSLALLRCSAERAPCLLVFGAIRTSNIIGWQHAPTTAKLATKCISRLEMNRALYGHRLSLPGIKSFFDAFIFRTTTHLDPRSPATMRFFNPIALVLLAVTAHHAYAVIDLDECVAAAGQCGFFWGTLPCCQGECVYQSVSIFIFLSALETGNHYTWANVYCL